MSNSPAELVAIARAAHLVGDRSLKRAAVRELRTQFGIRITFERPASDTKPTKASEDMRAVAS